MIEAKAAAPGTTGHPCNCDCKACSGQCCELECLIQPRFYCGQLLTDQDLTVLLDWVKAKAALARYRHGWGVVCGLEVQCQTTPGYTPVLKITPGYAIDCCGNDIVICSDTTVDLLACCKPKTPPCSETTPRSQEEKDATKIPFGLWELPKSEVQAVDLLIRYAESQTDSRPGLARGGCGGTIDCEYTRTHEGYTLDCSPVDDCTDPTEKGWDDWFQGYQRGLNKLLQSLDRLYDAQDSPGTLDRLIAWLRQNPLYSFCFVNEWLCDPHSSETLPDGWFNDVVFWIVQDWRNHYLQCDCYGCGPDTAVPLARVWLWRHKDNRGKDCCKPIYISGYPPFRRPVSMECWPAPAGSVSLAPYVWQTRDSTCIALRKLGFVDILFEVFNDTDLDSLRRRFESEEIIHVSCEDQNQVVAYYREDHCGQDRIVYFGHSPEALKNTVTESANPPSGSSRRRPAKRG